MTPAATGHRRSPALQHFLARFCALVTQRAAPIPAASALAAAVTVAVERVAEPGSVAPARLPVCRRFIPTLRGSLDAAEEVAALARCLMVIEPGLAWRRRPGAAADGVGFEANHANATILGQGGLETRDDLRIGVSLLGPSTTYPEHHHPPDEIYLALSTGEWRQDDGPWFAPGLGNIVFNRSDTRHGMRSGEAGLLAVWVLWPTRAV